jgi:hypothetical protein
MIDGLVLGAITWISYLMTFHHFPKPVKQFLLKNFFIADTVAMVSTFMLLTSISKSVAAVVGSIVCGLLVEMTLIVYGWFNKSTV